MTELRLICEGTDSLPLKLYKERIPYTVETILETHQQVYEDRAYEIELCPESPISRIQVYINDEYIPSGYRDNRILFTEYGATILFKDRIGFGHISLEIEYSDGNSEWLYSELFSILIKDTTKNQAIDAMLKYIYENQENILYKSVSASSIDDNFKNSYTDFWSQIILYEEIAGIYEEYYGFFKANCRYRLEKESVLDRVEKLQYVDSRTIQYITQHPEYLKRESVGIKYGQQTFLPNKTLVVQNRITKDTYENQIVCSFIDRVASEVNKVRTEIQDWINSFNIDDGSSDGYIRSSNLLFVNALDILKEFNDRISRIESKLQTLCVSYRQIFDFEWNPLSSMPKPTAVFMNLPQYNRIYTCIYRWFGKTGYSLEKEKLMFSFHDAPSIYEGYVLVKLLCQIIDKGYELVEAKNVTYPIPGRWEDKKKAYNNTFVFHGGDKTLTLYYEPIVYDSDMSKLNALGIYRNNSVSMERDTDREKYGRYYAPDYVIKLESQGQESYVICDAKFSYHDKVRSKLIPDLTYKYLISVSPIDDASNIKGLYVFYGITDDYDRTESFYNNQLQQTTPIKPFVEMMPLSEQVSYSAQSINSDDLLSVLGA